MGKFLIFCAAEFDALAAPVGAEDFLLAADGGLRHLNKLNLKPHGILGDFDSLGFVPEGAQVFPVEKDDTDSIYAMRMGLERGYRDFVLYGGLGGSRMDHSIANLQSLLFLAARGARGRIYGDGSCCTLIKNESISFPAEMKGNVSVFCMDGEARGVSIKGLKYELENAVLRSDFPIGVSNSFTGKTGHIAVRQGTLLVFYRGTYPENLY